MEKMEYIGVWSCRSRTGIKLSINIDLSFAQ